MRTSFELLSWSKRSTEQTEIASLPVMSMELGSSLGGDLPSLTVAGGIVLSLQTEKLRCPIKVIIQDLCRDSRQLLLHPAGLCLWMISIQRVHSRRHWKCILHLFRHPHWCVPHLQDLHLYTHMLSLLQDLYQHVLHLLQDPQGLLEMIVRFLWTVVLFLMWCTQQHSLGAEFHLNSDLGEMLIIGYVRHPRGHPSFPWRFPMSQIQATALLQVRWCSVHTCIWQLFY